MYRQGLGDCFLLALGKGDSDPFYMLIDCGVLVGQVEGRPDIRQVAEHIADATGGRLDVLVATHEHWDHVSGFVDAADVFREKFEIGEIWFAWTENPKDSVARELREHQASKEKALRVAAAHLSGGNAFGTALDNVLGFLGADKRRTTAAAMENLKGWSKPRYLRPDSDPVDVTPSARVYVLGPPRDVKKIRQVNDKKSDPQTYHLAQMMMDTHTAFLAAVFDASHRDDDPIPRQPFDRRHEIMECHPKYKEYKSKAFDAPNQWREISSDWLRSAATLALDMDNATNNTSLALAIELGPGGKVLLFPADAQVGNWMSWHDQTWKDSSGETVTTDDLLSRTVLYKIGHHCSHNATLRQRGLDLMTSDELIALAPLDRDTAEKKRWPMPWPKLRQALLKQTKGRILQVDDKKSPDDRDCPSNCTAEDWKKFQRVASASPDGMYFDVVIGS
jgi:hypothetical protein